MPNASDDAGELMAQRLRELGVHAELTVQGDGALCHEIYLGPSLASPSMDGSGQELEMRILASGSGGMLLMEGPPGGPSWLIGCFSEERLEDLASAVRERSALITTAR